MFVESKNGITHLFFRVYIDESSMVSEVTTTVTNVWQIYKSDEFDTGINAMNEQVTK